MATTKAGQRQAGSAMGDQSESECLRGDREEKYG